MVTVKHAAVIFSPITTTGKCNHINQWIIVFVNNFFFLCVLWPPSFMNMDSIALAQSDL